MPGQNLGAPFLERIMRKGRKQNALLNMPQSGGVNMPSPTGMGSGQRNPPTPQPTAAAPAPAATPSAAPVAPMAPAVEQIPPLPSLEEEFPSDMLKDSDGGKVLQVTSLTDRFYRAYGRMPDEVDMYVLSFRKRFEENRGRPPTKEDVLAAVRRTVSRREAKEI